MSLWSERLYSLLPERDRIQSAIHFTLFSAIIGLLGLSTYIGTKSLVQRDMQARLDMEANDIQRAFLERIQSYSDTLLNLRAFISRMGIKDQEDFKNLLSEMKVFDYYTGVSAISLAVVFPKDQQAQYEKTLNLKFNSFEESKMDSELGAVLITSEPGTLRRNQLMGFDYFTEPQRAETLTQALALGTTVITPPLTLLIDQMSNSHTPGFVMMVPLETNRNIFTIPGKSTPTTAVLLAGFRYPVLMNEIFGPPSLENEKWNFVLSSVGEGQTTLLYDRFNPTDDNKPLLKSEKKFSIYGQSFQITATPLPSFFTNSDKFLPLVACIGVLMVGALMLLLYRSTLNQLSEEKMARLRARKTHDKLKAQTTLLSKLNRFGMTISKQFDPGIVLQKFFEFGEKEDFEFVSILREDEDSSDLVLITPLGQSQSNIGLSQVNELFGAVNRIGRSDVDHSPEFLQELKLSSLSDWQMIRVRFNQRSSFLIIGLRSESIEESDIELMKSTFSQLVVALETAVLLQRAEEASRLKTAFLANMSHEIRTPLNAILGFTQILTRTNPDDQRKVQLVENVEKNTGLLTRLIDDILDIAKVEAGKIDIALVRTSFESLLNDTLQVFSLRAQEKDISFSLEIKTSLPRFIRTDEYRFKQILFNLISNAVKFTDVGGVTVRVYSELKNDIAQLSFEIEDSGIGIAKESHDKLFTPFYQGDLSTTRRFGGSGLGLTLSRRLAVEMNGDIRLMSSEPGRGTIFSFTIECHALLSQGTFRELTSQKSKAENKDSVQKTPSVDKPLIGRNILLVEDSEDNQIIFTHFLKQAGAEVELAGDGRSALQKARSFKNLDLILMDIQIPFVDGREVTRTLRSEGFDLPIIALTAHALESEKRSCKEAGLDDQITKPVSYPQFISSILKNITEETKDPQTFI